MGAGASASAGGLSHAKLLEATKSTRGIVDIILEYLIRELNIRDFYLLSSPSECKKYVLFLANTLASKFIEFQITPTRDKSGTIAFRSIKDLTEPSESERRQRQTLCLTLAYFYVRIFQIYGALAITLLDDAATGEETGTLQIMGNSGTLRIPGTTPYLTTGPTDVFTRKKGGALPKDLGSFEIFCPYITDIGLERGYPLRSSRFQMNLVPEGGLGSGQRSGKIYVKMEGRSFKYFEIGITAEASIFGGVSLSFLTILFSDLRREIKEIKYNDEKLIRKTDFEFNKTGTDWKTSDGKTALQIVEEVAGPLHDWVRARTGTEAEQRQNERSLQKYVFEQKEGVDKALEITKLVNNLAVRRPYGHCIARALQLLRHAPVGDDAIESNICKAGFLEQRHSIPEGNIGKSVGIGAMAALFYDMIDASTPKLVMSQPSLKEYKEMMKQMAAIFTGKSIGEGVELASLGTGERDREICGSSSLGKGVSVPARVAQQVYSIVQRMYAVQLQHAAACAQILTQLFRISRKAGGEYEFHISPAVFQKGVLEVNRIGELARRLLVNYYSQCEAEYVNGMTLIGKNVLVREKTS